MSATVSPFHTSSIRPVSVTSPITAKSSSHLRKIASASASRPGLSTMSMRSWLSESIISYAVFCLKKKKKLQKHNPGRRTTFYVRGAIPDLRLPQEPVYLTSPAAHSQKADSRAPRRDIDQDDYNA